MPPLYIKEQYISYEIHYRVQNFPFNSVPIVGLIWFGNKLKIHSVEIQKRMNSIVRIKTQENCT